MKSMEERNEVRRLYHIEGKSLRTIARATGFHRDTIKRIVAERGPPQYRRSRLVRGHEQSIGERLNEERHHLTPLPGQPDAEKPFKPHRVSSLCLVRVNTNDYSAPCQYAHHYVVVRPTVGKVRIYHDDRLIAAHRRSYGRHRAIYEPWHYLALIERKPRALDDGAPMKRLELDPCFAVLRRRLEAGQIHRRRTQRFQHRRLDGPIHTKSTKGNTPFGSVVDLSAPAIIPWHAPSRATVPDMQFPAASAAAKQPRQQCQPRLGGPGFFVPVHPQVRCQVFLVPLVFLPGNISRMMIPNQSGWYL